MRCPCDHTTDAYLKTIMPLRTRFLRQLREPSRRGPSILRPRYRVVRNEGSAACYKFQADSYWERLSLSTDLVILC